MYTCAQEHMACEQGFAGNEEFYPTLPGKMQRSQVADCLRELAGTLWGMKSGRLMTLLTMMDQTRPQDWTTGVTEPVCFMQQTQLAQRLGKTERSIRNDEVAFERLGLIEKRTAANGSRSRSGQLGIVFSPLIKKIPQLIAKLDELRADRKEKEGLVRRRSHLKRRAQEALGELQLHRKYKHEVEAAMEEYSAWPSPESLRRRSLEAVIEHSYDAQSLVDKLLDLLRNCTNTSGQPEPNFRCNIQDTTQEDSLYCNTPSQIRTDLRSDTNINADAPKGASDCLESKYEAVREVRKNKFETRLTPGYLYELCSFDMKMHVDQAKGGRDTILHHDFINAAYDCGCAMGVNHSAWIEAIKEMGEFSAALCIILIDANRDHPVSPIRSPGGTLRAMTRKYRAGQLNVVGGLIGLAERMRSG